ncbi:1-aminocyclopropane-1-carboxylate deaminase [Leptospira santarosai]|uniref:1-aminocyclopropane-1-carboxylate deaminase n=1 Tax=Leptospira santarosai TaxID=28183 RepID=UPI0024AF9CFB|nr:1-aminocyclopropane-1-carboxylate deaminase [Leptospira santarosai]MDI7235917.1 1-aminocyclopropane-1-carboxylate deaminase [Leptospira santarosai]
MSVYNFRKPFFANDLKARFLSDSYHTFIQRIDFDCQSKLFIFRDDRLAMGIGTKFRKFLGIHSELEKRGIRKVVLQGELHGNALAAFAFLFRSFGYYVRSIVYSRDENKITRNSVLVRENSHSLETYFSRSDWKNAVLEIELKKVNVSNILDFEITYEGNWGIIPQFGFCRSACNGLNSLWERIVIDQYDRLVIDIGSGLTWLSAVNFFGDRIAVSGVSIGLSRKKMIPWLNDKKDLIDLKEIRIDEDQICEPTDRSGFGSINAKALGYCKSFREKHGICIEPIYSARTIRTIEVMMKNRDWKGRILYVHQGGLLNFPT